MVLSNTGQPISLVLGSPCILIGRRECLLPRLSLMALHHHLSLWVGLGWLYCSSRQAAHANGDLCVNSRQSEMAC